MKKSCIWFALISGVRVTHKTAPASKMCEPNLRFVTNMLMTLIQTAAKSAKENKIAAIFILLFTAFISVMIFSELPRVSEGRDSILQQLSGSAQLHAMVGDISRIYDTSATGSGFGNNMTVSIATHLVSDKGKFTVGGSASKIDSEWVLRDLEISVAGHEDAPVTLIKNGQILKPIQPLTKSPADSRPVNDNTWLGHALDLGAVLAGIVIVMLWFRRIKFFRRQISAFSSKFRTNKNRE
jgi:hypothetical protein